MADAVDFTGTRSEQSAFGSLGQTRDPAVPDLDWTDHTSSIGDTAGSMFMLHTIAGEVADQLRTRSQFSEAKVDPYFNPYAYYGASKDKFADFPALDYFVRSGELHNARSPEEFDAQAAGIRRELERRNVIANGGWLGLGTGMVLSMADVTSLVPIIGGAAKVGMLAKAGIVAANALTVGAASEAYLQHNQVTEVTPYETFKNLGVTTLLGAGLGAFAHVLTAGNVLRPGAKGNPLHLDTVVPGEGSLSAAEVSSRVQYAEGTGLGIVDTLGYKAGVPTAVAKHIATIDPESAGFLEGLHRTGIATVDNEAGVATRESAEEIWVADYSVKHRATLDTLNDVFYRMNAELGAGKFAPLKEDLAVVSGGRIRNPVTQAEFDTHLFMRINDPEYKSGNPVIDKYLTEAAGHVDRLMGYMFDKGVTYGIFDPKQKLDGYLRQRWVSHKISENPDAFESWLLQKLVKTPDAEWLHEGYQLTPEQFDSLPDTKAGLTDSYKVTNAEGKSETLEVPAGSKPPSGAELVKRAITKQEVLADWSVEKSAAELRQLEAQAAAAATEADNAKFAFRRDFVRARQAGTRVVRAELAETRAVVRENEAALAAARAEREKARAEVQAIADAAQAAREKTLARQQQLNPVHADVGASELDKLNKSLGIDAKVQGDGRIAPLLSVPSEKARLAAKELPLEAPKEPPVDTTAAMAEASGKAQRAAQALQQADARVAKLERRMEYLQQRVEDVTAKAEAARAARKVALAAAKDTALQARRTARAAKTAARKLAAASKRQGIEERAREITRLLQDRNQVPNGMAMFKKGTLDPIFDSARAKTRGLKLTPDELREAVKAGWLDTSVSGLLDSYTRDVGGRLSLLEKFGSVDLEPQVAAIKDRFAKLKTQAPDAKARTKLADAEGKLLRTVEVLRNRVMHIDGMPSDPGSALLWASKMARQINFLRYMGSPLLSSFTDLATASLSNGGMGKTLAGFGKRIKAHASGLKDVETRSILFGMENSIVFNRHARAMGLDEMEMTRGIGSGWTRKVTSVAEGGLRAMSEKMGILNGMAWWNSRLRYISGQVQLSNIMKDAGKLAKGAALPGHVVTEYARFGLSEGDLKGIAALISEHGEKNASGLIDPNGNAWKSTPRGEELHRKMLVALNRASEEAVIAPTHGDLPPLMTTAAGRLLLQFQSFGFAAVNKYVRNLRYKAVNGQAWDALLSTTWALGIGAGIYAFREGVIKNQPLSDKPASWVYESVDRSGLLMYFMPFFNAGFKLGAPALNSMGIDFIDVPSRYRQQGWLTSLFGPSLGLAEDITKTTTAANAGDWAGAMEKAKRLLPFQNLFYLDALWRRAHTSSND